jgi:hypothetical protein
VFLTYNKNFNKNRKKPMLEEFQVAAGSVVGRDHLKDLGWRNNQDAYFTHASDTCILAIVADGSSAAERSIVSHNEVGAKLGVRILGQCILEKMDGYLDPGQPGVFPWESVREEILTTIENLTHAMGGGSFSATIREHFLFTLVGALVTQYDTFVFSIGDGVVIVNGNVTRIGPFPDNQPPYLCYSLVKSSIDPRLCTFAIHHEAPTETISSILVGTDGVVELMEAVDKPLPGKIISAPEKPGSRVGPISQFWTDDRYFTNPDQVRRKLALVNNASVRLEQTELIRFHGLLEDDTTIAVIRRKPSTKE